MTVTIKRQVDTGLYGCVVSGIVGAKPWRGVVEVPVGVADDKSPEMYDALAVVGAAHAASEFGDQLESRGSRYVIRRRWAETGPAGRNPDPAVPPWPPPGASTTAGRALSTPALRDSGDAPRLDRRRASGPAGHTSLARAKGSAASRQR